MWIIYIVGFEWVFQEHRTENSQAKCKNIVFFFIKYFPTFISVVFVDLINVELSFRGQVVSASVLPLGWKFFFWILLTDITKAEVSKFSLSIFQENIVEFQVIMHQILFVMQKLKNRSYLMKPRLEVLEVDDFGVNWFYKLIKIGIAFLKFYAWTKAFFILHILLKSSVA